MAQNCPLFAVELVNLPNSVPPTTAADQCVAPKAVPWRIGKRGHRLGDPGLDGRYSRRSVAIPAEPLDDVYARAEELAKDHSAKLGTWSMDILHVAPAEILGCCHFLTGDRRQARLVEAVGLNLIWHEGQ